MAKRIEKVDLSVKDPFEDIRISAEKAEKEVNLLSDVIAKLNENIEKTSKKAKNISLTGANPKDADDMKQAMEKHREALRLAKEREKQEKLLTQAEKHREKALKDKWSAEQSLQKQREKSIAQIEREKAKTQEAERPYNKMSATLNKLRKEYKDLAVSGQENTASARKMRDEIQRLDKTLKGADASVGQYQRNVGNYTSAFGKMSSFLGTLGIGFSAGALLGGASRTIVEFDQAIADLVSITGAGGKDLEFFKKQAVDLGVTVKGGASAVIEAYKLIGSAKPELLSNAQALDAVTQSAITLSKASGMDLPSSATALTDAMNQFGASADEANKFINVLGAGAKFGSAEIPQITEALLRFGAVAKTSNVNIEESTALIEALAERGLKGADAGTALRNVMLKLGAPDALPIEAQKRMQDLGISFDKLQDTSIPFSERLEELKPLLNDNAALVKVFGTENAVAATNLLTSTDRIKELNAQVTGTDTAFEQANQRTQTLSQAFVEFRGTFEKLILDFYNGSGAGTGFANALGFITKNLPTIISGLAKLTAGFIAFKTVTAIANTDFKALISNFTKFKTEAGEGTSKMSGFGNAIKGIGWAVIISAVFELAKGLYDVASGAQAAREQHIALQKAIQNHSKDADTLLKKQQKNRDADLKSLDLEAKRTKMNESEYKKRVKLIEDEYNAKVKGNVRFTNEIRDIATKEAQYIAKMLKINADSTGKYTVAQYKEAGNAIRELGGRGDAYKRIDALKLSIASSNAELVVYNNELKSTIPEVGKLTFEADKNTESNKKNTKSIAEKTKKYKDAKDVIDELIAKQKEYDDANLAQQNELDEGLVTAQRTNLDFELDAEEKELQAVRDKYRRLEDLAIEFGYGQEELLEARLNEENEIRTKYAQEEQARIDEENAKKLEKEKQALAERRQLTKQFIDATIDEMKRLSDEEIKEIDERINAEKELQSNLQQQANSGSIEAQKSIEASKEAERKATLEKAKEQKKQQALDDIKTLYNLINSNLDNGDNVSIATTKAVASMSIVKSVASVFSKLTGFKDGTDFRLGDEHKPMFGGVDGHVVRVDSSEGIVRGDLMDKAERAGLKSMDDIVNSAVSYTHKSVPMTVVSNTFKTDKLERKLDAVIDAVKSKTEFSIDPFVVNGIAKGVVANTRNRNFTKKDIYRA